MPTFFIDSASINNLSVTGSLSVTDRFIVSGGFSFNSILTASLLGTASTATSVGNPTASQVSVSNVFGPFGANSVLSSSFSTTSSLSRNAVFSDSNRKTNNQIFQYLGNSTVGSTGGDAGWYFVSSTSATINTGSLYLSAIYIDSPCIVHGVTLTTSAQAFYSASNAYSGVGLYTYSLGTLTLVASSSYNSPNDFLNGKPSGPNYVAFQTGYTASADIHYVAFLFNFSSSALTPNLANYQFSARNSKWDFSNSAFLVGFINNQTTLPTSIAASTVSGQHTFWFTLSGSYL